VTVTLNGMTWSHPRGYDPLVATAAAWREQTGVEVAWDKRSLQDFESYPVEELARRYDLIVIDHPHVGQITAEGCLAPLDRSDYAGAAAALRAGSVGKSYASYTFDGHQWALPIDAAAQVMAYRADLLPTPPATWDEMLALARQGRVVVPMRVPHSLMLVMTLAANLGSPCPTGADAPFLSSRVGRRVLGMVSELAALLPPDAYHRDPIADSELLAESDGKLAVMPYGYGYVNYAIEGFRPRRLSFADIPVAGTLGPAGSVLGGTGIAVSAFSAHRAEAIAHAYWLAGADVQRGLYAAAGGQPGHAAAWEDDAVNAVTGDFYRNTRQTLEAAYLRPRHNGYMRFQAEAAERLNQGLRTGESPDSLVAALNRRFAESF
jgi:multiple sugar transport system substrate-binding protein